MDEQNKTKHTTVQTYAEDMAKAIEGDEGGGIIRKIIHSEEENEKQKREASPESIKNKFLMFGGLLLLVTSLITLFYFFSKHKALTVEIKEQLAPLIFTDKSSVLEIKGFSKEQIKQNITNEVGNILVKNGGIGGIYLTSDKRIIGLRDFVRLIKGNFVAGSTDFVSDNFLLGFFKSETGKDFFILIKMRSLPDIFDNMRAWEGKMLSDLHEFFGMSSVDDKKYLLTKNFEDDIVENKNARILYDDTDPLNRKIVMMYVFADDNSVIIANTKEALHEVMLRLAGSQVEK